MLIEVIVGAAGTKFIGGAFGFGSAEPRPVGVGLFRRLLSLITFFETLQIDQFPHRCLR